MPSAITNQQVTVNTPQGQQTIRNPLLQYDFNPLDHDGFIEPPWWNWDYTRRYPTDLSPKATSQQQQAIGAITSNFPSLNGRIGRILNQCHQYSAFANSDSSARTDGCPEGLEAIHNAIHTGMGGPNGTMTVLWYSAFDPVFWLHHVNIDHIFALWQGINPQDYSFNTPLSQSTFSMQAGTMMTPDSHLSPFHKDSQATPWTSNDVRDMTVFGYTYPEFVDGQTSPGQILAKAKALYGDGTSVPDGTLRKTKRSEKTHLPSKNFAHDQTHGKSSQDKSPARKTFHDKDRQPYHLPPSASLTRHNDHTPHMSTSMSTHNINGTTLTDYTATISFEAYALNGSFNVYIFLGQPQSEEPLSWATDANHCGTHSSFSSPGMHSKTVTTGIVPLNYALTQHVRAGVLPNLNSEHVLLFLTDKLTWRVMRYTGESVPPAQVPGLTVGCTSQNIRPAKRHDEFDTPVGSYQVQTGVTHGKPAGIKVGQQLHPTFPMPCSGSGCTTAPAAGSNTGSGSGYGSGSGSGSGAGYGSSPGSSSGNDRTAGAPSEPNTPAHHPYNAATDSDSNSNNVQPQQPPNHQKPDEPCTTTTSPFPVPFPASKPTPLPNFPGSQGKQPPSYHVPPAYGRPLPKYPVPVPPGNATVHYAPTGTAPVVAPLGTSVPAASKGAPQPAPPLYTPGSGTVRVVGRGIDVAALAALLGVVLL